MRRAAGLVLALLAAAGPPARADEVAPTEVPLALELEEPPAYGTFYERYEPTFYTGFAPRTLEPERVHLHVGRGNQLRVTSVLSDAVLEEYARDLWARARTYRGLIEAGRLVPTQNGGLEEFEQTLRELDIARLVGEEGGLAPAALRERNLRLLERLNPGRVFRIAIPVDALVRRWLADLREGDRSQPSRERQLELLNALLPTRLWLAELEAGDARALRELVRAAPPLGGELPDAFLRDYLALLERASGGRYPRRGDRLAFAEFTAIYPIGTFNDYTDYRGRKIPLYPTPGRRALTTHQRTGTVDHIPTKAIYSYSPWIPYMHVGTTMHNSFHTLWWRMEPGSTPFLPESWRRAAHNGSPGDGQRFLWLLSRGPMSHGCTHLTTGHINELRQLLPSETEKLYAVDAFLNRSYDYDVFDVDGDLAPEVMGVHYFIAYSLSAKRPKRLRVRNERHAYYDWLYGGELAYDGGGQGLFRDVHDGHFVERTARQGARYGEVALYEAAYEPERIQFYRLVDIPFARALRQVGARHSFPGLAPAAPGAAARGVR